MKYSFLGKTGLKVSKISFGKSINYFNFNFKGNWLNSDDKDKMERMVKLV